MSQETEERLLSSSIPAFDAPAALERFRRRASREAIVSRPTLGAALAARLSLAPVTVMRTAVATVAVVAIAIGAAATGVAETILTVFEPKQVATISVDPTQLRGIPDPSAYGTLTWIEQPSMRQVTDLGAAAQLAGFMPLAPAALPAGVPAQVRYSAAAEAKATFQFDEAKARAAAARVNATLPPMPPSIAATTLTLTGGPAVIQQYGGTRDADAASLSAAAPRLVIIQSKAPVVTSNGASVDELRDYALKQPGISPALAAQIRAIGDPVRTLLVPIGADLKDAKLVSVRGTQGYFVGDATGLGSAIVWLERGYVFEVLGSLKEAELVSLVNGLR